MHVVKNIVKYFRNIMYKPCLTADHTVYMRNPTGRDREWIGWTAEEVATHLAYCNNYSKSLPKIEYKDNGGNGC